LDPKDSSDNAKAQGLVSGETDALAYGLKGKSLSKDAAQPPSKLKLGLSEALGRSDKQEEVKNMMGEINDVVGEIDNLFSPMNQKAKPDLKSKSPKFNPAKYTKAEENDEMAVATGFVPDWAVTKTPPTAIATGNVPDWAVTKTDQIHTTQGEFNEKELEHLNEIELENAESSITLQPAAKNNFMIENSVHKDKDLEVEDIPNDEDDGEYDMVVDENEYFNLKASTYEEKVRNSYIYDRDIDEMKQFTGKFYDDEKDEFKNDYNDINNEEDYKMRSPPEPTPSEFIDNRIKDNQLNSLKNRRDYEKHSKQDPKPTQQNEDDDHGSSNEIENILMKNQSNEPKAGAKRQEWNRSNRRYNKKSGTMLTQDSNPLSNYKPAGTINEFDIDDVPEGILEGDDAIAQTPKPNTKYPVPSRENEFGETSFGNQSRQFNNMRGKSTSGIQVNESDYGQKQAEAKGMQEQPISSLSVPSQRFDSDSKPNIKSKIPTLRKAESKERKLGDSKKQIRSFIEEHSDGLDAQAAYSQNDDKSVGNDPSKYPSAYPHIRNDKFSAEETKITINNQAKESQSAERFTDNNFNISNQP